MSDHENLHENNQRKKRGPKPLLNEARQREICAIMSIGGTRAMAAYHVRCSVETIRRTALRDSRFRADLRKAEVDSEILYLRNIQAAAQDSKQWRSAAWALERLFPERYGRRQPHTITRAQLRHIVRRLGAGMVPEAHSAGTRRRALARVEKLVRAARKRVGRISGGSNHKLAPRKS
jgi:hypothetical protein